jgi:hypothetical protein
MLTGPGAAPEEVLPPVDVAGRSAAMNELPSAGGLGGGGGAIEVVGAEVAGKMEAGAVG